MKTGKVDFPDATYPIIFTQYFLDSDSKVLSKDPSAFKTIPVFSKALLVVLKNSIVMFSFTKV